MNNTKVIANSINHHDFRLDNDYINQNEDDTIRSVKLFLSRISDVLPEASLESLFNSNKSYGSHKNRAFKDESHKGSMDSLNGEEKKDASKEDLEQEEGRDRFLLKFDRITFFCLNLDNDQRVSRKCESFLLYRA